MAVTSFDKFALEYDRQMGDSGDYNHQNTIDPTLFEAIGNFKGKRIYDIACGNGYIARKMIKGGASEVWASDISESLIGLAKNKYSQDGIKYMIRSGDDFENIPENYFDLITINMAIFYIEDLDKLFSGSYKVLKEDGRIAFTNEHALGELSKADFKGRRTLEEVIDRTSSYLEEESNVYHNHWSETDDLLIYNRPISKYVDYLVRSGFLVDKFVEKEAKYKFESSDEMHSPIPKIYAIAAVKK